MFAPKFQFPLQNIMLAMVPLALACVAIRMRGDSTAWIVVSAILGIASAVGALVGGVRGMRRTFAFTFLGLFGGAYVLMVLFVLLALIVFFLGRMVG